LIFQNWRRRKVEETKMEAFRKMIKTRINIGKVLLLIGAALVAMVFILGERIKNMLDVPDFLRGVMYGFNIGIVCGFIIIVLRHMYRNISALKDDDKLKKLYIAESDERNLLILQKSGSIGINVNKIGLMIGASVSAYFSMAVFFTLLGACIFVSLTRGVLKLYYQKKY